MSITEIVIRLAVAVFVGGLLGINESRVSQIHKTALEKMAVALQSAGIHSSGAF